MRLSSNSITVGKTLNFLVADDLQKHQLGMRVAGVDSDYLTTANVSNSGGCELMYVRGAAAFGTGRLVHLDKDLNILDMPITGNTGRPVFVVVSNFSATSPFGWVGRSGIFPVQFTVAATAGAVFGGAAGQATPTAAAGRQLLNASTLVGSAAAFTRQAVTKAGTAFVTLIDTAGVFPGQVISGAGIPGGATVVSLDQDTRLVRISANATASGTVTATLTNTGFGVVQLCSSFVQGQIT